MNGKIDLTKSEQEVMELLWDKKIALTTNDIVNMSDTRSWKKSYVHILVNSLLNKNMVKVEGMVKSGKNYARMFSATMTKAEYSVQRVISNENISDDLIIPVMSGMFKKIEDKEVIDELQDELNKRKRELLCK